MGWMLWLVRLAAPAATANLFVIYCGEFWPDAAKPLPRFLLLTLLYGILTLINYRGVRESTMVSNVFTVAKLVPLFLVALAGAVYLFAGHKASANLTIGAGRSAWQQAALLLVFAYGGFETALTPLGEARDPRRDAVFALFTGLITCTLLYTAIQWVVIGVLPDPAHSARPLADVARLAMGPGGAAFVSIGASGFGLWLPQRKYSGSSSNHLRTGGEWRLPCHFFGDSSSIPHALCFDSCFCHPELAAGTVWHIYLERHALGGRTPSLLRTGLRIASGVSPQTAGSRVVSPSWRSFFWSAGSRDLPGTDLPG